MIKLTKPPLRIDLRYGFYLIGSSDKRIFSLLFFFNIFFLSSITYAQKSLVFVGDGAKSESNLQADDMAPTADAGPDQTLCDGEPILLDGSFGGSATSGTFYLVGPQGILTKKGLCPPPANCNFQLTPPPGILGATEPVVETYIFVTDDPTGTYGPAVDTVMITINPPAIADAGPDQTICAGSPVLLSGTFGGMATSGSFSGGSGTFSGNVYTPGAADIAAGFATLTYTTDDPPGPCPAARDQVTIKIASCAPYCTHTQNYYGKRIGRTCEEGIVLMKKIIAASINNMPGQKLYLGLGNDSTSKGGSFTAIASEAGILNHLLPGFGEPEILKADYNLSKTIYFPPFKRRSINNILLSQSMTLALNIYLTDDFSKSVGSVLLQGDWLVTRKKTTSRDCSNPEPATCSSEPGAIRSWHLPPGLLFALGKNNSVLDLLTMGSRALGGEVPKGVTLQDIVSAIEAVNNAFNGCRYLVGFYPCAKTCADLNSPCSSATNQFTTNVSSKILAGRPVALKVKAYPNPYNDRVTLSVESQLSGNASLDIYNMIGQKVETVYNGYLFAGNKVIEFTIPPGNRKNLVYILKVGDQHVSGKLIHPE